MIFNFKNFINEELKISNMDSNTLEQTKRNLMFRLNEYRTYILSNIHYNFKTNQIEYKDFEQIDTKIILRELTNEFSEEFVEELNIFTLLRKLNQILKLKKRNTKKIIRKSFDDYYKSIDVRIDNIKGIDLNDDKFDQLRK